MRDDLLSNRKIAPSHDRLQKGSALFVFKVAWYKRRGPTVPFFEPVTPHKDVGSVITLDNKLSYFKGVPPSFLRVASVTVADSVSSPKDIAPHV